MTNLLKLPTWADDEHIYAVIETPRGSTCKLDFDPETCGRSHWPSR
ncbi:hypothetical protein Nham_3986 [Nitrobacter hamburgensis X14]|uniref:Uncharacterized protein n=1 Tax=Nitrobacter hamburgensis (strain DSM 10229 / NCIMB 13809 / X14) TaxID=323097 RepID=Q1QGI9_NITHX|nr:hypothetical protein [Nitrobacter hamburgensis]ABE64658.1 hypothetical protein Nham_3986 [Nitrobacter hamburgensis X14]